MKVNEFHCHNKEKTKELGGIWKVEDGVCTDLLVISDGNFTYLHKTDSHKVENGAVFLLFSISST